MGVWLVPPVLSKGAYERAGERFDPPDMWFQQRQAAVRVWCPAKLNLFFAVLTRREDGYHEIETLMAAVDRYDTLDVSCDPSGEVSISCGWGGGLQPSVDEALGGLPEADQNLAVRAVRLLQERSGIGLGARLRLVKRIPAAAGLGGASSDAAGALIAANRLWGLGWPRPRLAQVAADLGSDVPFFLGTTVAICRGRGEAIESVAGARPFFAVVVRPPVGLNTATVYGRCTPAAPPEPAESIIRLLRAGELGRRKTRLYNGLEPAASELTPWISRLREELGRTDCRAFGMTGSGSSYFGLCRDRGHARRVAAILRARQLGQVFAAASISPWEHATG